MAVTKIKSMIPPTTYGPGSDKVQLAHVAAGVCLNISSQTNKDKLPKTKEETQSETQLEWSTKCQKLIKSQVNTTISCSCICIFTSKSPTRALPNKNKNKNQCI